MRIRNKILLYFSTTVISLTILSSVIIYLLFSAYREEEFQQRQNQKIKLTIELLTEYREMSEELTRIMDRLTIHDFYDEKMLLFDRHKNLIYRSIDDLPISNYEEILNELSPSTQWIETKEGKYDIVGVYVENENNHFYAVSKALDEFGYSKLDFLRNTLIVITLIISIIVLLVTYYLSARIAKPIMAFAEKLNNIDIGEGNVSELGIEASSYELNNLTEKFNQLIKRTNEAFDFQKYAIQHISHELKTPIAVLVSELERAKSLSDTSEKNSVIDNQLVRAKSLGEIIGILLEISKIEAGQPVKKDNLRLDDVIFELISELAVIQPSFQFAVHFEPESFDDKHLVLPSNKLLIRQAFSNIMDNCIKYSSDQKALIHVDCRVDGEIKISFTNQGNPIQKDEEKHLFRHFFRSKNNQGVSGFGLGLVLTQKIIQLHNGKISYSNPGDKLNVFEVRFFSLAEDGHRKTSV